DTAHVIRYEDLRLNPHGEATKVIEKIGLDESVRLRMGSEDAMVRNIRPEKSPTFRSGGIGDWKSFFKDHHIEAYQEVMTETAEALGYGLH
ncbi:MAG: sulfotransferase domain-containing protein, partial [Thermoplasmata archaeon]|nr:sulfotransferase domain-containing protein [Thermoplasmata archaeon]